ncbi:galactose-specific lectin nattectin [Amia ocellicauda]|uniref:galactose-specific lectin nattectin n=1 Tax=Amia ocellicauda TaxID=2972642 RepID=UPI003464B2AC
MKSLYLLCLVGTVAMASTTDLPDCAAGSCTARCPVWGFRHWRRVGRSCFHYFNTAKSFIQAELTCRAQRRSAHLASVHSRYEDRQIFLLISRSNRRNPRTWLGGFRFPQSNKFMWIDGSNWTYENWTPGNPNNEYLEEHCTEMNWSQNEKWNDHDCNNLKPFVCRFPLRRAEENKE